MCSCSNFVETRPSEITTDDFTGNRPSYITSDFDGDTDYDNFLTEKMRNRRKQVKAGVDSGLSRKDARKQALESIPKTKLKEIIEKIKSGQQINVVQTPLGDVKLDPKIDDRLNELSDALKQDPNANPIQEEEPSFFQKNKMYIIGGVVLVAGIFVYMKYIKK
jgi:DNA polymerase II small subunit/DNA polymerase delta subunit B